MPIDQAPKFVRFLVHNRYLVDEIYKHPCLWNLVEREDATAKKCSWDEVAKALNISRGEAGMKWQIVCQSYKRKMEKKGGEKFGSYRLRWLEPHLLSNEDLAKMDTSESEQDDNDSTSGGKKHKAVGHAVDDASTSGGKKRKAGSQAADDACISGSMNRKASIPMTCCERAAGKAAKEAVDDLKRQLLPLLKTAAEALNKAVSILEG